MSTPPIRTRRIAAAIFVLGTALFGCRRTVYVTQVQAAPMPPPPPQPQAQVVYVDADADGDGSVDDFREPLSYYGVWVNVAPYGWVWQPAPDMAGPDFTPYSSGGYWAVNDDGDWVFRSRYHAQWGWATYHYGRWTYNDMYGWVWVPGTRWAPSWVEWRYGGGYVGFVPLGPPGVVVHTHHWCYVESRYWGSADVHHHRVSADRVHHVHASAQPVMGSQGGQGQAYIKPGPPVADLRAAGAIIPQEKIKAPEKGYIKVQGRAALEGAAERKASGRVVTTPQVRASAGVGASAGAAVGAAAGPSAGSGVRDVGSPMPQPAPAAGGGVQPGVVQPGVQPQPTPGTRPSGVPDPSPGSRPSGIPQPTPQPVTRPSPTPHPTPTPVTRPQPTPQPTPQPVTRPQPTPQPPAATPRPTPKPATTTKPKPTRDTKKKR